MLAGGLDVLEAQRHLAEAVAGVDLADYRARPLGGLERASERGLRLLWPFPAPVQVAELLRRVHDAHVRPQELAQLERLGQRPLGVGVLVQPCQCLTKPGERRREVHALVQCPGQVGRVPEGAVAACRADPDSKRQVADRHLRAHQAEPVPACHGELHGGLVMRGGVLELVGLPCRIAQADQGVDLRQRVQPVLVRRAQRGQRAFRRRTVIGDQGGVGRVGQLHLPLPYVPRDLELRAGQRGYLRIGQEVEPAAQAHRSRHGNAADQRLRAVAARAASPGVVNKARNFATAVALCPHAISMADRVLGPLADVEPVVFAAGDPANPEYCLDLTGGSLESGTKAQLWKCGNSQQFKFPNVS